MRWAMSASPFRQLVVAAGEGAVAAHAAGQYIDEMRGKNISRTGI